MVTLLLQSRLIKLLICAVITVVICAYFFWLLFDHFVSNRRSKTVQIGSTVFIVRIGKKQYVSYFSKCSKEFNTSSEIDSSKLFVLRHDAEAAAEVSGGIVLTLPINIDAPNELKY